MSRIRLGRLSLGLGIVAAAAAAGAVAAAPPFNWRGLGWCTASGSAASGGGSRRATS